MNSLKKAAIFMGALTGGVLGGSITLAGKMTKVDFLDELGEGIIDSALLTGEIIGEVISGTADIVAGGLTKDQEKIRCGGDELGHAGKQVVGNAVMNLRMMGENGGEIFRGIKNKDKARTLSAVKTLAKMATIGAVTFGAIQLKKNDGKSDEIKGQS